MVSKASTAQSAKRKKTEDMADSPPKRVTRARTAKVTQDDASTASVTSKRAPSKTNANTRKTAAAAVASKTTVPKTKAPCTAKPSKRSTRTVQPPAQPEYELDPSEEAETVETTQPKVASARGGRKKLTDPVEPEPAPAAEPTKPKGRQTRTAKAATTNKARKTTNATPAQDAKEESQQVQEEPAKKSTRSRAATNAAPKPSTGKAATKSSTAKRVKFQDDVDKENIPVEVGGMKKPATRATGLRAKPVRKPATSRATTRGKKSADEAAVVQEVPASESAPLSPKKVSQVAKAGSISSEDELVVEKSPVHSPKKSPVKPPSSPVRNSPVKPFDSPVRYLEKVEEARPSSPPSPSSPQKVTTSILESPARRPPASPFKAGLSVSPKKVDLVFSPSKSLLNTTLNKTPMKSSLLQESPRKGKLPSSSIKLALQASKSPFKGSMLQSPARRPMVSPFKTTAPKSARKENTTTHVDSPIVEAASSPLRAIRSPERMMPVHNITPEVKKHELATESLQEPMIASPLKTLVNDSPAEEQNVVDEEKVLSTEEVEEPEDVHRSEDIEQSEVVMATAFPFIVEDTAPRRISMESGSTDELASPDKKYAPTPLRKNGNVAEDFSTPSTAARVAMLESANNGVSFTPLVGKLNGWAASSPQKTESTKPSRKTRGVFSLGNYIDSPVTEEENSSIVVGSPAKVSFFEDEMIVINNENQEDSNVETTIADIFDEVKADAPEADLAEEVTLDAIRISQESHSSEEYGDENAVPTVAEVLREEQDASDETLTCTPAKVFTPMKRATQRSQEFHTVSKVPLRPSAEDSPLKIPRQRSRSFGGALATLSERKVDISNALEETTVFRSHAPEETAEEAETAGTPMTPKLAAALSPKTPVSNIKLDAETPGRTVRKGVIPDVLKGAVVYVDVHTSEGADASGIFVDLLTQMGARCLKQWTWNPRASMGNSLEGASSLSDDSPQTSPSAGKPGITHVVYKDGGKRTLEKVRASNGVVLCVGVGWVLDCEREDRWLDEADYAIDTSFVPRGGSRRRKSMEPRALANLGGSLVAANSNSEATPAKTNISPTKEFLTFNTPASRRDTFIIERPPVELEEGEAQVKPAAEPPATPMVTFNADDLDESALGSPTTPYYLSKGAQLVQRTCPPKQLIQSGSLFPSSGNIEDQPDENVRRRLIEARRKSMQWVSKTRSPLGRTVSYGK